MISYSEQMERTARDYKLRLERMRLVHEQRERLLMLERDRAIERIKQAALISDNEPSAVWQALELLDGGKSKEAFIQSFTNKTA